MSEISYGLDHDHLHPRRSTAVLRKLHEPPADTLALVFGQNSMDVEAPNWVPTARRICST